MKGERVKKEKSEKAIHRVRVTLFHLFTLRLLNIN